MKRINYLLVTLFALFIVSCTEEVRNYSGNIQGIVTEAGTTKPLSGVQVSVVDLGTSSTTGSDGQFLIKDIDAKSKKIK